MPRAKRRYRTGTTNRFSRVEVIRPPTMTTASGCSISWPGELPAITSGTSASPVASVVMRIGESRSSAPRMTSSGPKASPSKRSRCWKWLIIRMPLRAAMPKTVKNPTSEPIERIPSAPSTTASRPPTSAIGKVTNERIASRQLRNEACSSRKIPIAAAMPKRIMSCCASWRSLYSPSSSAW